MFYFIFDRIEATKKAIEKYKTTLNRIQTERNNFKDIIKNVETMENESLKTVNDAADFISKTSHKIPLVDLDPTKDVKAIRNLAKEYYDGAAIMTIQRTDPYTVNAVMESARKRYDKNLNRLKEMRGENPVKDIFGDIK